MVDPTEARTCVTNLIERILIEHDKGAPLELSELVRLTGAPAESVRAALDAVFGYHTQLDAERNRSSAAPQSLAGEGVGPGTQVGPFLIEAEIGRGGMGVVYRARQTTLGNRIVALKVLPRSLASRDPRFVERFRREAALAATIHHENVAEVFGFEATPRALAFAMRCVEGPTLHDVLAELCARHDGPVRRTTTEHILACVQLIRTVANALAKIHAAKLVHRDVKPSNIVLERVGPAAHALDGRPVLVDFGLLRLVGDTDLTGTHTALGTPAYASPESMLGRDLDARADVFSLAATLHDMVTVTSPNGRQPASAGLPDARSVNPTVDARLAAILNMALQERNELRYEHAGALCDELDAWLRGEPVRALPTGSVARLRLWVRRDRSRAVGLAAACTIALIGLGIAVLLGNWMWSATALARHAEELERAGDLPRAFLAYRDLVEQANVSLLPWLAGERSHGVAHWREGGVLHAAVTHLLAAETASASGGRTADEEFELERAHDRLLELLLDQQQAPIHPSVQTFLMGELRAHNPEARVRIALESWADYLLVTKSPQPVSADLLATFVAIADGEGIWQPETREAATSALATVRKFEAFRSLLAMLDHAPTREFARLAVNGTVHVYRWLHRDDGPAFAMLDDRSVMERWATAAEDVDRRFGAEWSSALAAHLSWWERPLEPPFPYRNALALPASVRSRVDATYRQLAVQWANDREAILHAEDPNDWSHPNHAYLNASGRGALDYESQIWFPRADDDVEKPLDAARGSASPGWSGIRFQKGPRPEERLCGTVRAASFWSGAILNPDSLIDEKQPAYLKLDRPGHSRLRLVSSVPRSAQRLEIRLQHMIGGRPPLRHSGTVGYVIHVAGSDWRMQSSIDARAELISSALVDHHVLADRDEIEVVVDYVHGNTTYRILSVELAWLAEPK